MKSHDFRIGTSLVSDQRNRRWFILITEELTPIGGSYSGLTWSFASPALCERGHGSLARCRVDGDSFLTKAPASPLGLPFTGAPKISGP